MRTVVAALCIGLVVSGCGDDNVEIPSAEELRERVVTVDELASPWVSSPESEPAVITDANRGDLATIDLCPDASDAFKQRTADIQWQVPGGVGYVIDPQSVFTPALIELLLADDPAVITSTFEMLREGMTSCLPTTMTLPDAGEFSVTPLSMSAVGDDRFGVWYRQTDQPDGNDRWDIRQVIVRDGPILMWLSETEINTTTQPIVTEEAFDAVIVAAAGRLAGEQADGDGTQLANPASTYCIEQGGELEIVNEVGGQVGYCVLPDGQRIEEWTYFRSQTTTP